MNMNTQDYSLKDSLRLKISRISEKYLKFPRKTIGYILSYVICKCLDNLLRSHDRKITKCVGGVNYQLDTRDLIDFRLFYFGCNEKHLVNYLQAQISDKPTVLWDVGANLGSVSFPLIHACPNLIIHGFEPSPPVFNRLQNNVKLNNYPHLQIHQWAIGSECGSASFFVSSTSGNSGVGSLAITPNSSSIPVLVDCYTGDFIIENNLVPEPSFIKIDVEGFEYEVLYGLKSFLSSKKYLQIVFEHEPYRFKERGINPSEIVNFLQSLGFEIYQILPKKSFYGVSENSLKKFHASMLEYKCDFVAMHQDATSLGLTHTHKLTII